MSSHRGGYGEGKLSRKDCGVKRNLVFVRRCTFPNLPAGRSPALNPRYSVCRREARTTLDASRASDRQHMVRAASLFAAAFLSCASAFAQANSPAGNPAPSAVRSADTLPQDKHEGMTVSADSYTEAARAKAKFGKANPLAVGILPVEVFLHNETAQPIHIDLTTIQLEVHFPSGRHQDVDWLTIGDVANAIAHPNGPPAPKTPRFPIGVPTGADKKADKLAEILRPFVLDGDIVPPMATIHGFLFFDLGQDMSLADGASLYLPDVTNLPSKKPLMFFEVLLDKRG
jgi:hypothetical protein